MAQSITENKQEASILKNQRQLTKGQKRLYALLVECLTEDKPVTFGAVYSLWLETVTRNTLNGQPAGYNYYLDKPALVPLNEWEIKNRVNMWLVHNIGALVVKGYLKIIPAFNL